jgi:hypothetical protein
MRLGSGLSKLHLHTDSYILKKIGEVSVIRSAILTYLTLSDVSTYGSK